MFGCLVAGRLPQANLEQLDETHLVFSLESASTINHLAVFMLGTVPFPPGYACTVHFHWPGRGFQLLGMLSNDKPSAIFRARGTYGPQETRSQAAFTSVPGTQTDDNVTAILGISIEPLDVVHQQIATLPAATAASGIQPQSSPSAVASPDASLLAERIVKNLFNYLSSFSSSGSLARDSMVPLEVVRRWYETLLSKLRAGGTRFLEREE